MANIQIPAELEVVGSKYVAVDSNVIRGGLYSCQTMDELLAIDAASHFKDGMLAWIASEKEYYAYDATKKVWEKAKLGGNGTPIYTSQQIAEIGENKIDGDYIHIPSPNELGDDALGNQVAPYTFQYESKTDANYLDILFRTIRELQYEVTKLKNSFSYGINSYTGTETAMTAKINTYEDVEDVEPLWAIDEDGLSYITHVDFTSSCILTPTANIDMSYTNKYVINGIVKWTDEEHNNLINELDDVKLFVYMTMSNKNAKIRLTNIETTDDEDDLIIDLSHISHGSCDVYNYMILVSRQMPQIEDSPTLYGKNFVYIAITNRYNDQLIARGYYNGDDRLYEGMVELDYRYRIVDVTWEDTSLYKFALYSKYQNFTNGLSPDNETISDEGYKFRAAHITIRSVEKTEDLTTIQNYLPENELIYNEENSTLYIKSKNKIKAIGSGSNSDPIGGDDDNTEDTMTQEELIEALSNLGIISTETDGEFNIKMNNVADMSFINSNTGTTYKFSVASDGELHKQEIPSTTLLDRLKTRNISINGSFEKRGFIAKLLCGENGLSYTQTGNVGQYSDRVKIGAFYAPLTTDIENHKIGCSHAYVELENTTKNDIPLEGCRLYHLSVDNNSRNVLNHIDLTGVLPAGGTYLIRGCQYADFDDANTYIKVKTFDQEWYTGDGNLIDFKVDPSYKGYGMCLIFAKTVTYEGATQKVEEYNITATTSPYNSSSTPYKYDDHFIDAINYHTVSMGDDVRKWTAKSHIATSNSIIRNTFMLDPAKQAFQALDSEKKDSARNRWATTTDISCLNLDKEFIEYPKSDLKFPVELFTPKASFEGKNVCSEKTHLDKNKPNMPTCSFGIDIFKTRCFNWVSAGVFDEFVWIRKKGSESWEGRFESYKNGTASDFIAEGSKMNKKTMDATTQRVIYNRIIGKFPGSLDIFSTHKCIVNITDTELSEYTYTNNGVEEPIYAYNNKWYTTSAHTTEVTDSTKLATIKIAGPSVYEYVVGRADKLGQPDVEHTSDIMTFTIYPSSYTPKLYQTTDQQGFHWIEYQVWGASSKIINDLIVNDTTKTLMPNSEAPVIGTTYQKEDNTIITITSANKETFYNSALKKYLIPLYKPAEKIVPILLNTGDMTQSGARINEWLDYYNAGKTLFSHLEQMNCVGNNDLTPVDINELGFGDDTEKSNSYFFSLFYCYEVDTTGIIPLPICNGKYIPSVYYFGSRNHRIIMLNSEFTQTTCKDWFKIVDGANVYNIYTGFVINETGTYTHIESNPTLQTTLGFTPIYNMVYKMLDTAPNNVVVACHEMPFTVITRDNLVKTTDVAKLSRSRSTSALCGSHMNQITMSETCGLNWFSRLLEHFHNKCKLCIGGHKHTYAATWSIAENYSYTNGGVKRSLTDPMPMSSTLNNAMEKSIDWNGTYTYNNGILTEGTGSGSFTVHRSKLPYISKDVRSMKYNDTTTMEQAAVALNQGTHFLPYTYAPSLNRGITYFMLQATGYKLTSNKELPSYLQAYSKIVPLTQHSWTDGKLSDKADNNQKHPMFATIEFSDSNVNVTLARIENIFDSGFKFTQSDFSKNDVVIKYLHTADNSIYGAWNTTKSPLLAL